MEKKDEGFEYRSLEEYQNKFYPKSSKKQSFEGEKSHVLGGKLARNALNKFFSLEPPN